MRGKVSGEQLVQVDKGDPFASPVWRSPVYQTPGSLITVVQLWRLLVALVVFVVRHPYVDLVTAVLVLVYLNAGWLGVAVVAAVAVAGLVGLRVARPDWFTRWVGVPVRCRRRWWFYRRRWHAVMTITHLARVYRGRVMFPVLGPVEASGFVDRVGVRLVSGQSPAEFADRADHLAHGFGAHLCRVRTSAPGAVVLELVRRDALADPMPALPINPVVDLRALPVGRREDGAPWLLKLHGTHVLVAGLTGAGKGSILWSAVRAMLPAMAAGVVRVWAADPKLMELAFGRPIFDRYGRYAADPTHIADMLDAAVEAMRDRARVFAGKQRDHTPTIEHPFLVVLVDEIAFLTAYLPDKQLKDRVKAALATLTTQGRAVGVCVVAALQDPRKEVLGIRNLFPDKIALRLDEPEQVDMVLGDGARDRGAHADQISPLPHLGAGVGYVRLETDPDPVRVRAAFVSDNDIRAMVAACAPPAGLRAVDGGEAA